MATPIKALAFCGSLRKASYNRMLLKTAIELAPEEMSIEEGEIGGLPSTMPICINLSCRPRFGSSVSGPRPPMRSYSSPRNTTTRSPRR